MALTTSQVTALTDSIAKAATDFNTNFITGTATATTTINNGVGGTGATSATLGRVLAYAGVPDLPDELSFLPRANTTAASVAAYLTGLRTLNTFFLQYLPLLDVLDTAQSGLNAFLTTNTLSVNAMMANAFNYYCTNAVTLGYRTAATVPTPISVANFFPYAAIDDMWDLTCSGATTFSTNVVGANATTSVAGGGIAQLYIYKVNAGNAAGGAQFTVTYTTASGGTATATYTTSSGTPAASGSLASAYAISGAIGQGITAVTGTGMTSGEQYRFGMQLTRTANY